jgi:hypothetical protein
MQISKFVLINIKKFLGEFRLKRREKATKKNKLIKSFFLILVFFVLGYCFFYLIPDSFKKSKKLNIDTGLWQKFKKRILDEDMPFGNLKTNKIDMSEVGSKSSLGKEAPYRIEKSKEIYPKDARKELDLILEEIE